MDRDSRGRWPSLVVAGLCVVALAVGCEVKTSDRDITFINVEELRELLADEGERTLVIDVRRWGEYDAGHIPGAVCVPVSELRRNDPVLAGATSLVVYAGSYESPLSPAAAKKLIAEGYVNVYDFRGGLEFWEEEGGEVEQTPGWIIDGASAMSASSDTVEQVVVEEEDGGN
ncbi:MAG: rhodanese-like domain-containing protein [Planctomycetota bacterium]